MKINQIINEMTAGSVATVAMPLGKTQTRATETVQVKGLKPADKIAKAKKKGPYANSLVEGAMKDLDIARQDLNRMSPQQFFAAYRMTKQEFLAKYGKLLNTQKPVHEAKKDFLGKLQKNIDKSNQKKKETDEKVKQHQQDDKKKVEEAKLDEDDVIIVPGTKMKRKTGFVQHGQSRVDHEVEMARSDVLATMKNAKAIYKMLQDRSEDEGIEGWVQEKLIKANDYLNAVKEYYDEKMMQEAGVIAGGGVGENAQQPVMPTKPQQPVKKKPLTPFGPGQKDVGEAATREHPKAVKQALDGLERAMNDLILTSPEERQKHQQNVKQKLKTQQLAGPKGTLPEGQVDEKAVSKAQQKFMGMAHAMQKGKKIPGASKELKDVAKTMKKGDVKDFAKTKHKGLPQHVAKKD